MYLGALDLAVVRLRIGGRMVVIASGVRWYDDEARTPGLSFRSMMMKGEIVL